VSNGWNELDRASGLVAAVLLGFALGGGLLFSARATGTRRRPSWWLDLHVFLGGLAFAFIVLHVYASYRDDLSDIDLAQIFIPMTAEGWEWGITWGVLAAYVFAAVVFSSWPSRRFSRRTWLTVHLFSVPATFLAAAHAWMVGSDRHGLWFQGLLALLAGLAVYPAVLRLAGVIARPRPGRERAGATARQPVRSR
jgi:DMSO/TMAO reductase YedYZ heme-binding membrane subunit